MGARGAALAARPARPAPARERPATRLEIERLGDHWEERLEAARFFFPPDKAASMRLALRNLWSRMPLMRADVQILHGVVRQLTWKSRDD